LMPSEVAMVFHVLRYGRARGGRVVIERTTFYLVARSPCPCRAF
jgi:hypothetical protein